MDNSSVDGSSQSPKEDPTHTSYEFAIPYTAKKEETTPQEQQKEKMPRITPIESVESLAFRARGLAGKFVDEFGNVLDWDGTVLGSVQGDLPSMVGRPVSESGKVLDTSGEVVGYVSENHTSPPPLRELQGGLKVDEAGNIYDHQGVVVGKMNNNNNHSRREEKSPAQDGGNKGSGSKQAGEQTSDAPSTSTPSPSEVYLDVKSTHEGIQLIIKIPTIFNREK